MNIICNKEILLNSINIVSKAVANKTTLPILECVLLKASPVEFKMMSNDLEIGIESKLKDVNIIEVGSVALEARIFSEIIKRLPDEDIQISTDEKNLTTIKCRNSEYKISGQPGSEFPDLPRIKKDSEYELRQLDLKNMIRQTIFSISVDESKPAFTGELFEINNGYLNMVSLDGYRVSFRRIPIEKEDVKSIIPGKTLNEINKILSTENDNKISLYFTDKHILFDLGDNIIISRTIEGEFIKYEQIFSNDYTTTITAERKNFIMCLERASLLSRDNKKTPVKLEIKSDKIIITSNTELGTAYEELEIDMDGNEMNIAFNPKYLIDVLKVIEDDEITMYFTSSLSPCIIKSKESEDYKYLILPVRLSA